MRGRVPDPFRLQLRELDRGPDRVYPAGAHPAVEAHSVDVYAVVGRVRLDLEKDRLALGDADVMAETLDRRIAPAVDVPLGRGITRQCVLSSNAAFRQFRLGTVPELTELGAQKRVRALREGERPVGAELDRLRGIGGAGLEPDHDAHA